MKYQCNENRRRCRRWFFTNTTEQRGKDGICIEMIHSCSLAKLGIKKERAAERSLEKPLKQIKRFHSLGRDQENY